MKTLDFVTDVSVIKCVGRGCLMCFGLLDHRTSNFLTNYCSGMCRTAYS